MHHIFMNSDKTPAQQQFYKQLKIELDMHIAHGENDLYIIYSNGSLQIVHNKKN